MQKLAKHITYEIAKTSFGLYLVDELRLHGGKEFPTETDVKKILLRVNPACTATELQTARQISRYCQTDKNYLKDAKEETLDKVAIAMLATTNSFAAFREKVNPQLKAYKYYSHYVAKAEAYLTGLGAKYKNKEGNKFGELFAFTGQQQVYLSMISYHFGEADKALPAVTFGAESDLSTERILRTLFGSYNIPAPQYLPEGGFTQVLDAGQPNTVYIAIGLFGNRLTEWLTANGSLGPHLQILPSNKCITLDGKSYFANRDENTDFALFCKCQLPNGSTIIVLGGIEGFGTQRLGEYLQSQWPLPLALFTEKKHTILLYKTLDSTVTLEQAI